MERQTRQDDLFPPFRQMIRDLVSRLRAEKTPIPLDVYETWRLPTRQLELWRRGRETLGPHATFTGDPEKLADAMFRNAVVHADPKALGSTVTAAKPFWSFHQFGMAADLVFFPKASKGSPGAPSWDEPAKGMWDRYTELAHAVGLRTLSREKPHVEFPCAIDALRRGEYPEGGSHDWEAGLLRMIEDGRRAGLWVPPIADGRPAIIATAEAAL